MNASKYMLTSILSLCVYFDLYDSKLVSSAFTLDIPAEIKEAVGRLTNHSKGVLTTLNQLESKLVQAKLVHLQINKLKTSRHYMSLEDIKGPIL